MTFLLFVSSQGGSILSKKVSEVRDDKEQQDAKYTFQVHFVIIYNAKKIIRCLDAVVKKYYVQF